MGLSPSPLRPGTWVGVRVELNYRTSSWYLRERLDGRKIPTHLVIRSVRSEVFCVGSKGETHRKSVFPLYMVVIDPYLREMIRMPPSTSLIETQSPSLAAFMASWSPCLQFPARGSFSLV